MPVDVDPFTKRFLAIPQAYLGIAFGFGIPMAYAAHTGAVPEVFGLIAAGFMIGALTLVFILRQQMTRPSKLFRSSRRLPARRIAR